MAELGTVYVDVEGDFNKFQKQSKSGFGAIGKLAAKAFVAGFVIKKAVDVFGDLISSSSDLSESINAVTVSYGEAADAVLEIGANAAQTKGLSNSAFNALATQFSGFAKQLATDGETVADVVEDMTTRVADFASVHNLEVEEAAEKFQSALAGETEAVRKYGIDVSAAAVQTYAYAEGIAEAGATLTEAEKVQARYGLLMQETTTWAGDFANTSGEVANQQRIAAASFEDAKSKLGDGLIPIMSAALQIINTAFIPALDALVPVFQSIGEVIAPIITAIGDWVAALFAGGEAAADATSWLTDLGAAFEGFWEPVQGILDSFSELWAYVVEEFNANSEWFEEILADMQVFFAEVWEKIGGIVVQAMELIAAVIDVAVKAIMFIWDNFGEEILLAARFVWDHIKIVIDTVLGVIQGVLDVFIGLFTGDWQRMKDGLSKIWSSLWEGVLGIVRNYIGFIGDLLGSLGPKIGGWLSDLGPILWKLIQDAWDGFLDIVKEMSGQAVDYVKEMPAKFVSALSSIGSLLYNLGRDLIQGLINGIKSMAGSVVSAIKSSVIDVIPGPIKSFFGIGSPSKFMMQYGSWISEGMAIGIEDGAGGVTRAVDSLLASPTGALTGTISTSGVQSSFGVTNNFHGPVGGSMASFAKEIAYEGAKELRFAYA